VDDDEVLGGKDFHAHDVLGSTLLIGLCVQEASFLGVNGEDNLQRRPVNIRPLRKVDCENGTLCFIVMVTRSRTSTTKQCLCSFFFHYNSNLRDEPTVISAIVVDVCRLGATL